VARPLLRSRPGSSAFLGPCGDDPSRVNGAAAPSAVKGKRRGRGASPHPWLPSPAHCRV